MKKGGKSGEKGNKMEDEGRIREKRKEEEKENGI